MRLNSWIDSLVSEEHSIFILTDDSRPYPPGNYRKLQKEAILADEFDGRMMTEMYSMSLSMSMILNDYPLIYSMSMSMGY
jgi:hypothetical protein